ncbi:MAG: porin [Candidatus Xenobia bacterium]
MLALILTFVPARAQTAATPTPTPTPTATPSSVAQDGAGVEQPTPTPLIFHPTFLTQNWYQSDNEGGQQWRARRFELGTFVETPDVTFRVLADLEKGPNGIDNSILEEAWMRFTLQPDDHLFVGQFKAPMSVEGLLANADIPFAERSLVVNAIGLHFEDGVMWEHRSQHVEFEMATFAGPGSARPNQNGVHELSARHMIHPKPHLQLRGAGYWGRQTFGNLLGVDNRYSLEGQWTPGHWFFMGEAEQGELNDTTARGWYFMAGRDLRPNVEGLMRVEEFNPNVNIGSTDEHDLTLGLNYVWHPPEDEIQINYLFRNGPPGLAPNLLRINFQHAIR